MCPGKIFLKCLISIWPEIIKSFKLINDFNPRTILRKINESRPVRL